jgi:cell filamentation protein
MARRSDTWDSYFYAPPDDRTLCNLFDERDPDLLARLEYVETAERHRELFAGEVTMPLTFDAAHVRAIHRHLFQDIYEWAGEFRTLNKLKPGAMRDFADAQSGEIDRYLVEVHRLVYNTEWSQLDRDGFAAAAADVYAHLNQAHPFREGNGRTSKVFMEHVAQRSSFTLDYALVTPEQWNSASEFSRPDIGQFQVVPDSVLPVFQRIAMNKRASDH